MNPPEVDYLKSQIFSHLSLFFDPKIRGLFSDGLIRFLPYEETDTIREKTIVIPFDIPVPQNPEAPYRVRFNNTELTLWNKIPPPSNNDWEAMPDASAPLWYKNRHGTLIPAWNLFGNLFELLTFGEERECGRQDRHGRFIAAFSPRLRFNLLEIPAFNEAVAALVAACSGIRESGGPRFDLDGLLKPPVVVLSHDCDLLRGDDLWTQAVRGIRIFLPLLKIKLPKISNLWWIFRNAATPHRFYFDNVTGMIDLERCFGYHSTFYLLNGSGGRFGARSGFAPIPELLKKVPSEWDVGIHYNYDTYLNHEHFAAQIKQLRAVINSDIVVGRAHYLRFDPEKSFSFLQRYGICADESSGFADRIGYRNGIAGCFRPYNTTSRTSLDIWEVPLMIMDAIIVKQYGPEWKRVFSQLLRHLSLIGGALSIVFHPGQFFNPEFKEMLGVYHQMLIESRRWGARSLTARSLVDESRQTT